MSEKKKGKGRYHSWIDTSNNNLFTPAYVNTHHASRARITGEKTLL